MRCFEFLVVWLQQPERQIEVNITSMHKAIDLNMVYTITLFLSLVFLNRCYGLQVTFIFNMHGVDKITHQEILHGYEAET